MRSLGIRYLDRRSRRPQPAVRAAGRGDGAVPAGVTMKKKIYDFMGKRFTFYVSDNAKQFDTGYFVEGETMTLWVDGKVAEPATVEKIGVELPAERLSILDS